MVFGNRDLWPYGKGEDGNSLLYSCGGFSNLFINVRFEGFHGGDYEEWRLLGCYAVWLL
jgi:hypothetical protein